MVDKEEVRWLIVRTKLDGSKRVGCIHNWELRVEDPLIGGKRGMKQQF